MSPWKLLIPFVLLWGTDVVFCIDPCLLTCQCLFISTANSSLVIDLDHLTHANLGYSLHSQENLCQNASFHVRCQEKCEQDALSITNSLDFGAKINPYYNLGQLLCLEWPKRHPSRSPIVGPFTLGSKFDCSFTNDFHSVVRSNISLGFITTKSLNCSKASPSASRALLVLDKLALTFCTATLLVTLRAVL